MYICIDCGVIEPVDNNGNKHCNICGLLAIKTDNSDIAM